MRPFQLVSALALVTLTMGCGSKPPTSPTAVTPAVTGLAIHGAEAILTGAAADYTVAVTLSDGTSKAATPAWTSSNPAVATINDAGRLEGRSHGSTILTASSAGQTVSKTIRVINNYGGSWDGQFVVNGCNAPPGACASLEIDFFSFPVSLTVSHSESDPGQVTAEFVLPTFGQLQSLLSGNVTADGRLNLSGSAPLTNGGVSGTFTVGAWDTILVDGNSMKGHWVQRLTLVKPAYDEIMENELVTMKRY